MQSALTFIAFLFASLSTYSFLRIRGSGKRVSFIYWWAFPVGAFVWEDLFVFSMYYTLIALVTLFVFDLRIGLLFLASFWVIRATGETLYYFLQQFLVPKHHPHDISEQFRILRSIFGNISDQKCFIMMQVWIQCLLVTSVVLLILLLKNWNTIPRVF